MALILQTATGIVPSIYAMQVMGAHLFQGAEGLRPGHCLSSLCAELVYPVRSGEPLHHQAKCKQEGNTRPIIS